MCVGAEVAIAMAALRSGVSGARLADFATVTNDGEIVASELRSRVKCERSPELLRGRAKVAESY